MMVIDHHNWHLTSIVYGYNKIVYGYNKIELTETNSEAY